MNETVKSGPRFYFALPRFIALLRGGDTRRAETNAMEAWFVGLMMYLIHYLFFAHFIPPRLSPWLTALLLIVLAFWVWLFWLLLLYLNSVFIHLVRLGGLFRTISTRRAQSILWGIFTTVMACALLQDSPWVREIGAIWLVAVTLNLASAAVLAFCNATRLSGK
jgi:hypothetical protein